MSDSNDRYPPEIEELADAGQSQTADLSVLDGLIERARENVGEPFKPEIIAALAALKSQDQAAFEKIRSDLQSAGVRMRPLDKEISRVNLRVLQGGEGAAEESARRLSSYGIRDGATVHYKFSTQYVTEERLSNFVARIVTEELRDDGVEKTAVFQVCGSLWTGEELPPAQIPAGRFLSLNWIMEVWGSRAIINAGFNARDHLRCAIQEFSSDVTRSVVYTHTGWTKIGGEWAYLSSSGGLGPGGLVEGVQVALPDSLAPFILPKPPTGPELTDAVRASLTLIDVAPEHIAVALHALIARAILGGTGFSLHLSGPTGAFKTAVAAIVQAHFGQGFDERHLPGSWSSTANATEGLAFIAKDMILVVDDFAPRGSTYDQARFHRDADRVFRAVGNHSGRRRMRADGSLRPVKPPRSIILSTGEDVPTGQSVRARLLVLEVGPADVEADRLTELQRAARTGLLAQATAGFVHWLAPRLDEVRARFDRLVLEWRGHSFRHRRTTDNVGQLFAAHRIWREFAVESGALTAAEAAALGDRVQTALLATGEAQAAIQGAEDVVERFFALLRGALVAGECYLEDADSTGPPSQPEKTGRVERWGWRRFEGGSGEKAWVRDEPQGRQIGWVRQSDLYLQPDATFRVLQGFAAGQGAAVPVTQRTMWGRLKERGLLPSAEEGRNTSRPIIQGQQVRCLHLCVDTLFPPMTGLSGLPGLEDREATPDCASASDRSPLSQHENGGAGYESGLREKIEGTGDHASEPDSPRSPLSSAENGKEEQEVLEF